MDRPIVAVTMGDPAGIGPEIIIKAFMNGEIQNVSRPIVVGDAKVLTDALKYTKIGQVEINAVKNVNDARFMKGVIDVIDLEQIDPLKIKMGQVSAVCGKAAVAYLDKAIKLAMDKEVDAIATAPINKEAIHKAGYHFHGHTGDTREADKDEELCDDVRLRSFLGDAGHDPHSALQSEQEHYQEKSPQHHQARQRVPVTERGKKPKIGVAGLNPHAGEAGIFGKEEKTAIRPAVEEAKKLGINVKGPVSPDGIFYLANVGVFDIVIAMYHDQGLIPLKLLSFNRSVNVTVGLPIIRTSVDHGTGFDIAGKGWANPTSLVEAIKVAAHFAKVKKEQ